VTEDPYDLERFVAAQDGSRMYERALAELRQGYKTSHWMWFVFPQVTGLGYSEMSRRYAIRSLDEARAYLAHPVLGPRLLECSKIVAGTHDRSMEILFGDIDAQKLCSSMTLFHRADPEQAVFRRVIDAFYGGKPDPETDQRLRTG
jgi:uncharacterized protein (DUF1810 family)